MFNSRSIYGFSRLWARLGLIASAIAPCAAAVVFETTSAYHHIQVLDEQGTRILSFDGSQETKMMLANPMLGHFEYTEYFHLPWLWNTNMANVLMIGLGGASTQRSFQYYYPYVAVDTAEIDSAVVQVARDWFFLKQTPKLRVHVEDGRQFLRRAQTIYDAIIVDAYTGNRYGSYIPYHLATIEFFQLASRQMTTNGVLAYNVISTWQGHRADILGALYKTMKHVFPQVYLCPARESWNVVILGVKSAENLTPPMLIQRGRERVMSGRVKLRTFLLRVQSVRSNAPPAAATSPLLTDDFAPVDGLLSRVPAIILKR